MWYTRQEVVHTNKMNPYGAIVVDVDTSFTSILRSTAVVDAISLVFTVTVQVWGGREERRGSEGEGGREEVERREEREGKKGRDKVRGREEGKRGRKKVRKGKYDSQLPLQSPHLH